MVAYSGNNFQFFFRGYVDLFHLGFPKSDCAGGTSLIRIIPVEQTFGQ